MKILFIGENWFGSSARSLKEALARVDDIELDEIAEDAAFPRARGFWLKAVNRLTCGAYRREFNEDVKKKVKEFRPDVVIAYKGWNVHADLVRDIQKLGAFAVDIYPDCSPHAHGAAHRAAVGTYDLVISTKPYHPDIWNEEYGYSNRCVFVPRGYDPAFHLVSSAPLEQPYDVVMVGTYREEYALLLEQLATEIDGHDIQVAIGGAGWNEQRERFPSSWLFLGPVRGQSYISVLRQGKICIAPLTTNMVTAGKKQHGDVETARTYELAAAHCFFIHRRTSYLMQLYDQDEVPMFNDAAELARNIIFYLSNDNLRKRMASRAHARAVPAYSWDARSAQFISVIRDELKSLLAREQR